MVNLRLITWRVYIMPDVIAKGETLWFNAVLLLPSDLVFSAIPRDLIFQESKAEGEKSQF